ncbi:MAG: hypothetical protein L6R35_006489 [Caloplaca aegaea]|nr:MAG: hypothetical protein L6R35_006489 [Caloplaca aegaea]
MRFPCLSANVGALFFTGRCLAHFSLTQLQPIAGFSNACTRAYETTFDECSLSDFYQGAVCSAQCVAYLEAMTTLLNDKCKGLTTYPNTLIGMFFENKAIKQLCPDVDITTVSAAGPGQSSTTSQAEPTVRPTVSPSEISVELTSITTSTTVTSSIDSSTTEIASSSTTTSAESASSIASPGPGIGGGSASSPIENDTTLSPTVSSTRAQRTQATAESQNDSGGTDDDGNGGTVLDAASTAGRGPGPRSWFWPISAGFAVAVWSL